MKGQWLVDSKTIIENLCISNTFFREKIVNDPRMRAIEIKKSKRKSWWEADKAKEICLAIMNEYED